MVLLFLYHSAWVLCYLGARFVGLVIFHSRRDISFILQNHRINIVEMNQVIRLFENFDYLTISVVLDCRSQQWFPFRCHFFRTHR
jgi:hypothetical protein